MTYTMWPRLPHEGFYKQVLCFVVLSWSGVIDCGSDYIWTFYSSYPEELHQNNVFHLCKRFCLVFLLNKLCLRNTVLLCKAQLEGLRGQGICYAVSLENIMIKIRLNDINLLIIKPYHFYQLKKTNICCYGSGFIMISLELA